MTKLEKLKEIFPYDWHIFTAPIDWVCEEYKDEEGITSILKGIKMTNNIEEVIDYLIDFSEYSEYQEQLNILLEYIDKLEEQINESKINK